MKVMGRIIGICEMVIRNDRFYYKPMIYGEKFE